MPYVYLVDGITPRLTMSKFINIELPNNKISNIMLKTLLFNNVNTNTNIVETINIIVSIKLIVDSSANHESPSL